MASFYLNTTTDLFLNWLDRMNFRDIGRVYDVFAGTTEAGATYFILSCLRKLKRTYDVRATVGEVYVQDVRWDSDETIVREEVIDYWIKPIGKNRIEFMVVWDGIQGVIWELFQELIEAYPEAKPKFTEWVSTLTGREEFWSARFDRWWNREQLFMLPSNLVLDSVIILMNLHNSGEDITSTVMKYDKIVRENLKRACEHTKGMPRFDFQCEHTLSAWEAWITRLQDKFECLRIAKRLYKWAGTGVQEGATVWNSFMKNTRKTRLGNTPEFWEWNQREMLLYPPVNLDNPGVIKESARSGKGDKNQRPDWFPKTKNTQDKWKQIWRLRIKMEKEYQGLWEEGRVDDPEPTTSDLSDKVKLEMGVNYSNRRLRDIVKAGKNGWLN